MEDLASWKVHIEEPVMTTYKGIDVYKLTTLGAGPVDAAGAQHARARSTSRRWATTAPRYIHTLYQVMNLAFADRDFYYGDPYFPPEEPIKGLLSKEYAKARVEADRLGEERPRREAGRSVSVPGRDEPVHGAASRSGRRTPAKATPAPRRSAIASTRASTPARPRSRRPTRRAGSSRSRRAAAGCPRPSPAGPASA